MSLGLSYTPLLQTTSDSLFFSSTFDLPQRLHATNLSYLRSINTPKASRWACRKRQALFLKCQTTSQRTPMAGDKMLVYVPPHPLIKHWVSVLRNEQTPCPVFKSALAELGRLLIYEASRDWLPTIGGEIQSPMGVAAVEFVDPRKPVSIVPILRAGLALAEHASSILPATKTYHLGISRDEKTLKPTVYLNKLPKEFPKDSRVFVIDPMLATGGTVVAALELIKERGVDNKQIKLISAVAAHPALEKLSKEFPGLHVYAGILDPIVDKKGFIIPGLGDAGDRSFGTDAAEVELAAQAAKSLASFEI